MPMWNKMKCSPATITPAKAQCKFYEYLTRWYQILFSQSHKPRNTTIQIVSLPIPSSQEAVKQSCEALWLCLWVIFFIIIMKYLGKVEGMNFCGLLLCLLLQSLYKLADQLFVEDITASFHRNNKREQVDTQTNSTQVGLLWVHYLATTEFFVL